MESRTFKTGGENFGNNETEFEKKNKTDFIGPHILKC